MQTHISTTLMDEHIANPFITNNKSISDLFRDLYYYILKTDLILKMGWYEHTGDWDPFYIIKLKNGTTIETTTGYTELDLPGTPWDKLIWASPDKDFPKSIRIYIDNPKDDENPKQKLIKIKDIESIQICS